MFKVNTVPLSIALCFFLPLSYLKATWARKHSWLATVLRSWKRERWETEIPSIQSKFRLDSSLYLGCIDLMSWAWGNSRYVLDMQIILFYLERLIKKSLIAWWSQLMIKTTKYATFLLCIEQFFYNISLKIHHLLCFVFYRYQIGTQSFVLVF